MTLKKYHVNTRQLTSVLPLSDEFTYAPDTNYLFDLDYLGVIDVMGEKSTEFLQGQLSCDLREVTSLQIQQGALCNLKGRVMALLDVIKWLDIHLVLPIDLLDATQASLAKTAMFSKVKLERSPSFQLMGFFLQNTHDLIPFDMTLPSEPLKVTVNEQQVLCYHLGNHFYLFLVTPEQASSLKDQFNQHQQRRGSLAWHALQMQENRIEIYPESRGLFLPHRLGLQLSGYLSFNKGCYKGQEIIARTHYRAKLKHEMKLFTIQTSHSPASGDKLVTEDGHVEIGELIDYCPIGDEKFLVATSIVFDHPDIVQINHQPAAIELCSVIPRPT